MGISEAKEGETWSHKELIAYLQSKGVRLYSYRTNRGCFYGPAMYFLTVSVKYPSLLDQEAELGSWNGRAYVQKLASAQGAKDKAGTGGDRAFSWGRFYFSGDDAFLKQMQDALTK
jgi:hypothetical protein